MRWAAPACSRRGPRREAPATFGTCRLPPQSSSPPGREGERTPRYARDVLLQLLAWPGGAWGSAQAGGAHSAPRCSASAHDAPLRRLRAGSYGLRGAAPRAAGGGPRGDLCSRAGCLSVPDRRAARQGVVRVEQGPPRGCAPAVPAQQQAALVPVGLLLPADIHPEAESCLLRGGGWRPGGAGSRARRWRLPPHWCVHSGSSRRAP